MRYSLMTGVVAAILNIASGAIAQAAPVFVETPKALDDIKRGDEDALRCALQYLSPTQISNCTFTMARMNARDGSDTRAYNAGLSFESWRDLDVDWVSDQKIVKSGQVTAAQLHDEEAATRAMYQLYRSGRDALGITDKQLLALMTKMTAQGRATTWDRMQFWAKQPH